MNTEKDFADLPENQNTNLQEQTQSSSDAASQKQNAGGDNDSDNPIITAILQTAYGYGTGTPIKLTGEMTDQQGNSIEVRMTAEMVMDNSVPASAGAGQHDPYGSGLHIKVNRGKVVFKRKRKPHDK